MDEIVKNMDEIWIAKDKVTLTNYHGITPEEKVFEKGRRFVLRKSKRFPDFLNSNYWKFQTLEGCCGKGFIGYACRYSFHKESPDHPEDVNLWFVGDVQRTGATVLS